MEKKYLITYNSEEVVTVSAHEGGGNIVTGTNVLITTLENAIIMLTALNVDASKVNEEIVRNNEEGQGMIL